MIVLDTNVLSEPLRAQPDAAVLKWLRDHPDSVVTAVSVGELLAGIALLPRGVRRTALTQGITEVLDAATVLAFDDSAARLYAQLRESRRALGRPLSVEDGMIAAICLSNDATLATRNTDDFEHLGLALVNPWSDS